MQTLESREDYLKKHEFVVPEDPILSMNVLEKRYHGEDALLDAITQGNASTALEILSSMGAIRFSSRSGDLVRDTKNRMLSFNTLLRRTAYTAGVHPFYIDVMSDNYARLVENATTTQEIDDITNQSGLYGHRYSGKELDVAKRMKSQINDSCQCKGTALKDSINNI